MENKQCKECNLYNSLGCPYAGYDWKENEECDEFRPLEHNEGVESLCETSHRKAIWHKVADGDLPAIYQDVLVAVKRHAKDGNDYIFTTIGKRRHYTPDVVVWHILGQHFTDDIIAWTELPEYKE